jgi:putative ABC transport system permease protein
MTRYPGVAVHWTDRLLRRVRALRHGAELDEELEAEIALHIELESAELVRQGVAPDEARRRARVAFGGVGRHAEAHRDARGVRWLEEMWQDLRYAVRSLGRSPAFTLAAVTVLALGIGASMAVFSAVDAVLLAALPYPDDHRLVRVHQQYSHDYLGTLSNVDFRALEEHARTLGDVGAMRGRAYPVRAGGEPRRIGVGQVTSGVFRALRLTPAHGRAIEPADEQTGAPRVVVVADAFAVREYGSARAALGKSITIDGIAHTVVGVLAPGVQRIAVIYVEVWPALQLGEPERRGPFGLHVVARLADGATLESARRELAAVSERIFPEWQSSFQDKEARLTPVPLRETIIGDSRRSLGILAAAVALVLLIAIANVSSLALVRSTTRWREIALRTVLGASRTRLVRLLLTESFVIVAAAALLGLVVAMTGVRVFEVIGADVPRLENVEIDARAMALGLGTAILAGIAIAVYPLALLVWRGGSESLRDGERTIGAGRRTQALRASFVVVEFALALPLLAGAGLLLNSFIRLQRVEPGFEPARILTISLALPSGAYDESSDVAAYWERALARVREVPGVIEAGLVDALPPVSGGINENNFDLIDRPVPPGGAQPISPWPTVNASYFDALDVPLLEGRMFTPADTGGVAPVVLVSRAWARHYYPDGSAVGRQLISGGCTTCPPTTVIGVVDDVKYLGLEGTSDAVYSPVTEGWSNDLKLVVRSATAAAEVTPRVRAALQSVDASVPLTAMSMSERMYLSLTEPRHWTALLGGFASTAVVLAAIGMFGLLSYTVSARRREIGVRMALGARAGSVVGLILRRGVGNALLGLALGLAATLAMRRWLSGALFDVSATDPATLITVTAILFGVALAACWLPARRAARIDPVEAIRAE